MRKFTKSLLTLVLLVLAVGSVKAEGKYEYTSYPLSTLISENTLVSMVVGSDMACGDNSNNQMYLKDVETYLPDFPSVGSYRFRVFVADDGTLPDGVSTLYRIRPYKSDGTTIYQGPWGHDGYLTDLSWTMNVNSPDGGSYFAISAVDGKENTYKISSYKQDGTKVRDNIFGKSEWIFCTISKKSSSDPLQDEKDALQDAITYANKHDSYAQTAASWTTLQTAISNGEAELVNESTTAELLTAATKAITDAIDGLELQEGYSNLTKDMLFHWTGWDADAIKGSAADCFYVLYEPTGQPYGDGSVNAFADISAYSKLVIISTGGQPRFLLNRDADGGQWNEDEAQSHLIDNTRGGWSAKYFSQEGNVYTVDLAQLVADKGFAHIHAIKANGNVTVSGMYLYKAPDPLAELKEALSEKIEEANLKSSVGKTEESYTALTNAKNDAITALNDAEATEESLTNAKNDLQAAIDGLKLAAGYTNLTKEMYYSWDSATSPSEGSVNPYCDYVLNSSTGQPYGNGNVPLLSFADLSTFDTFVILAKGGTPRILLNRDVENGQPSATESESHLIDNTNAGCMTWASKYFTTEGSNVTVDLKQLVADKGFAHLHTIKTVGGNVTVTDMLLYRTITVGETGYATFGTLYKNAKPNGVTAYAVNYTGGNKVSLTPVTTVSAGKGVIIEAAAGSYAPTFDVDAEETESDLLVSNGTVVGDGSTIYVLNKVNDKIGFYLLENGKKLEAGKAYLKIASNEARGFIGIDGMDVTGISTVQQAEGAKNDEIYNLNGQRVSNARKGLFIKNGVKFWVD